MLFSPSRNGIVSLYESGLPIVHVIISGVLPQCATPLISFILLLRGYSSVNCFVCSR